MRKAIMKRTDTLVIIAALTLMTLILASCGKSEFGVTANTGKRITITAENANKDASFITGSLEVVDGERIVILSDLTKGSVMVEIIEAPAEQNIDKLPETNGEAIMTANLKSTDGASGTVPAGLYQLRATCLDAATGTVQIEVKPAA